jgi:hypothetical protein
MDNTINKKKIIDFVANFSKIAKEQKWISDYDHEDDSIAVRIPVLSMEARKRYVTDDFAFYLTPEGEVQGIFIEYFISNFVAHHKDFKDVAKDIKEQEWKEEGGVMTLNKAEMKKLIPELQEAIIESIIPSRDLQKAA